jgi:hypothetical protein
VDSYTFHLPRRWVRLAVVIALTAAVVAPATALAFHYFDDVADGTTHAPGIEYVADKGITLGCDSDSYCPNDPLTRAQMATFLYRSSGNDPATPPSVNADMLDGLDSTQFQVLTTSSAGGGCTDVQAAVQTCAQVQIEVPAPGTVIVQGHASVITFGSQTNGYVGVSDSASSIGTSPSRVGPLDASGGGGGERWRFTAAPIGAFTVGAGTHTFYLTAQRTSPFDTNQVNVDQVFVNALFIPAG